MCALKHFQVQWVSLNLFIQNHQGVAACHGCTHRSPWQRSAGWKLVDFLKADKKQRVRGTACERDEEKSSAALLHSVVLSPITSSNAVSYSSSLRWPRSVPKLLSIWFNLMQSNWKGKTLRGAGAGTGVLLDSCCSILEQRRHCEKGNLQLRSPRIQAIYPRRTSASSGRAPSTFPDTGYLSLTLVLKMDVWLLLSYLEACY